MNKKDLKKIIDSNIHFYNELIFPLVAVALPLIMLLYKTRSLQPQESFYDRAKYTDDHGWVWVVRKGDNYTNIAKTYIGEDEDVRPYVDDLQAVNGSDYLIPGETIDIPNQDEPPAPAEPHA